MEDEKYRIIVEKTGVGACEMKFNPPRFVWVNKETCRALGYTEEELLQMNPLDLTDETGKSGFREAFKRQLAGEKVAPSSDFKIKTKNGKERWVSAHVTLTESNGVVDGALVLVHDITERKKAEDALRQSKERFAMIFNSNPAAIAIARLGEGVILDVNETFLRITGYEYEEVIGHTSTELKLFKNPEDRKLIPYLLRKQGAINNWTMTYRAKNGEIRDGLFSAEKIKISNEDCVVSTVLDVTENRKLERELEEYTKNLENIVNERTEKLKATERLAAIGATAGMVGHDIRNPLQAILGDIYLIASDVASLPEDEKKAYIDESIESIRKNVDYIDKIVRDLQYFATPLKPIVKEIDLDEIFQKVLFKKKLPENIDAKYVVEKEAEKIFSDATLVKRILGNLTINAVQAMPDGGKLEVSAHRNGDEVVIAVQDSGVGIPEEVMPNLFKPLFSTKAKGQGFGLAVVKRMTEALGGTVTCESEEGKGTKFIVYLPAPTRIGDIGLSV